MRVVSQQLECGFELHTRAVDARSNRGGRDGTRVGNLGIRQAGHFGQHECFALFVRQHRESLQQTDAESLAGRGRHFLVDRHERSAALPPRVVDPQIAGDPKQPRPLARGFVRHVPALERPHEHVLCQLFRALARTDHPQEIPIDGEVVPLEHVGRGGWQERHVLLLRTFGTAKSLRKTRRRSARVRRREHRQRLRL